MKFMNKLELVDKQEKKDKPENSRKIDYSLDADNGKIKWNADGRYPYRKKMKLLNYEQNKHELQIELLKAQSWIQDTKQRVVILFEGRDAAGKIANVTVMDDDPYDVDPTRLGSIRIRGSIFHGRWFPVTDHLVERRVDNAPGMVGPGSIGLSDDHTGGCTHHDCGCEVAAFMARHMTRDGWAA